MFVPSLSYFSKAKKERMELQNILPYLFYLFITVNLLHTLLFQSPPTMIVLLDVELDSAIRVRSTKHYEHLKKISRGELDFWERIETVLNSRKALKLSEFQNSN